MSDTPIQGLRVLVLDAGEGLGRTVCTILRDLGIDDVSVTDSPDKALEILAQRNFDLILGHMEMPGFEADSFARLLRQDAGMANAATPIILITDQPVKSKLLAALEAGVTSFLTGTFTPERLRSRIKNIMRSG